MMHCVQVVHSFNAATFDCIGVRSNVQVGKTKRNRANMVCSLMESMNIKIVGVQEPHFQSLDDIRFLDSVVEKSDYHRVGGMVSQGPGGVCLQVSRQWHVMRSK